MKSTIDTFAQDFTKYVKQYTDDVVEAITDETKSIAELGAERLRSIRMPEASEGGSARPMRRRQWTRYSKSWDVKETDGTFFYRARIYNKKHYRLTHLLEYGHMTRNGTTTRKFSHIKPIENDCEELLLRNTKKIIEKGGKL